ncbi:hypothetical protein MOSE0_G08416 [Monosporozyma servazzii]
MRNNCILWLAFALEVYSKDESDDIPIVSTDNFHGDYMGDDVIWKQDINDTLNEHHLHPALAITPTLSEYKRLTSPYETNSIDKVLNNSNNSTDDWVNISDGEVYKAYSVENKEISRSQYQIGNKSVYEINGLDMRLMQNNSIANDSSTQTAEIPVTEDVAVILRPNAFYLLAVMLLSLLA